MQKYATLVERKMLKNVIWLAIVAVHMAENDVRISPPPPPPPFPINEPRRIWVVLLRLFMPLLGLLSGPKDPDVTYASLLVDATHPSSAVMLDGVISVYCLGCVVSYFIFIKD